MATAIHIPATDPVTNMQMADPSHSNGQSEPIQVI